MRDDAVRCLHGYFHKILLREWTKFDRTTAYSCALRGTPFSLKRMEEARAHWDYVRKQHGEELRKCATTS